MCNTFIGENAYKGKLGKEAGGGWESWPTAV